MADDRIRKAGGAAETDKHADCGRCGGEMVLYRTGPHPKRTDFEVQRFECKDCRSQSARTAARSR
jgi:transposase-like protein